MRTWLPSLLDMCALDGNLVQSCHIKENALQGKIACANVVSDLYAMGVTECDNMLMLLGIAQKLTEKERDVVVPLMIRGFRVSPHA